MIEHGRVVAVEDDAYWVETISSNACGSCAAQKGCGQGLLSEYFEGRSNHLRVLKGAASDTEYALDDQISFEVADSALLASAFVVYTLPLIAMLVLAAVADALWQSTAAAPLGAAAGFIVGFLPARMMNSALRNSRRLQPVVVGPAPETAVHS